MRMPDVSLNVGMCVRNVAIQAVPPDVVEVLRVYLADRPTGQLVWSGTWFEDGAEMLRGDLEDAGVPYVIEGPNGPLFADFHSLRHSYIALLDRGGATLKEAMQLARHSDPKLTMAVYGRAQLHDLAARVERIPSLTSGAEATPRKAARATGTGGKAKPSPLHTAYTTSRRRGMAGEGG